MTPTVPKAARQVGRGRQKGQTTPTNPRMTQVIRLDRAPVGRSAGLGRMMWDGKELLLKFGVDKGWHGEKRLIPPG
ncbi:hypothetical protein GCM10023075_51380 [Streptosporangium album]